MALHGVAWCSAWRAETHRAPQLVASSICSGRAPKLSTHNLHRRRTEGGLGKGGPLAKAAATRDRLWERVTGPGRAATAGRQGSKGLPRGSTGTATAATTASGRCWYGRKSKPRGGTTARLGKHSRNCAKVGIEAGTTSGPGACKRCNKVPDTCACMWP